MTKGNNEVANGGKDKNMIKGKEYKCREVVRDKE